MPIKSGQDVTNLMNGELQPGQDVTDLMSGQDVTSLMNEPSGHWEQKGLTTQWMADQPADIENRPDAVMVGGIPDMFERLRQYAVNRVATNDWLPESVKPYAAAGASWSLEPARALAEIFTQPESIAMPGAVNRVGRLFERPSKAIIPEVLPPEVPPIRGALPAHENPFIAGEGGVQKADILRTNPAEEARLAGYPDTEPISVSEPTQGRAVDLSELRERERLASLRYGQFEHEGGVPLVLKDKPLMDIPPQSGDVRLGFEAQSTSDMPYPYSVVPERLRPRTMQSVTRALAGDEMAAPLTKTEPVEFVSAKPVIEKPVKPTPPITQGILPSAPKAVNVEAEAARKAWRAKHNIVKQETGLNIPETPADIKISPAVPAPIADGIKKGTEEFVKEAGKPSTLLKSIYTQLGEMGSAGKELVYRFQRAAQHRAEYDAAWTEPLLGAGAHLSRAERANFGAYVEGRMPIPNQRVNKAVVEWNRYQNMMGDTAIKEGLHLRRGKEVIPFEKIESGYWPHVPAERLDKKTIVDRLVSQGVSRYDAVRIAKRWEDTGEIFLGPQHSRLKDSFAYKDDFDVAIQHGRSMSRRIANHKNLGPKDIAGRDDAGVANLIEDTGQKDLAFELAKRLAGRDVKPSEPLMRGLNQVRKSMSLTSLPNFSIKNVILGQATNAQMVALSRHPIAAVREISQLLKSAYRDEIRAAGVYNTFNKTLLEEIGSWKNFDPFLIGAGEKINRSIAAAIGRSTVRTAFEDFKAGRNMGSAKYFLETLLARDPATITAITPEMERFAAGRMAEITQGLNNPGNLPYAWSNPVNSYLGVAGQMMLIFKKIGFQVTKTVKDTIVADPKVAIPAWLGITQVAGELAGDVGSLLTGKERPEELYERIPQNWANAFMLGLIWEMTTSAQYGPSAALGATAGPVGTKASELGHAVWKTGENLLSEDNDDPFRQLRRFGIRNLPLPGRERLKETDVY